MTSVNRRGEYTITTNRHDLDVAAIHDFLTRSYWSPDVPIGIVERAIENSLCFDPSRMMEILDADVYRPASKPAD